MPKVRQNITTNERGAGEDFERARPGIVFLAPSNEPWIERRGFVRCAGENDDAATDVRAVCFFDLGVWITVEERCRSRFGEPANLLVW